MEKSEPEIRSIRVNYSCPCLTCEEFIYYGEDANWCPGIGIWHKDCESPRSLQHEWDDLKRKEQLGLV